jgi:hypothetical protein
MPLLYGIDVHDRLEIEIDMKVVRDPLHNICLMTFKVNKDVSLVMLVSENFLMLLHIVLDELLHVVRFTR